MLAPCSGGYGLCGEGSHICNKDAVQAAAAVAVQLTQLQEVKHGWFHAWCAATAHGGA
jgi:hypothetical protein